MFAYFLLLMIKAFLYVAGSDLVLLFWIVVCQKPVGVLIAVFAVELCGRD